MSNLVGKTLLDRYHVQEFLGRGGMAEVYKVWDQTRSVHLALKLLSKELATDRVFMRRFKREAENLSKLQHPHIVRFYSLEQEDILAFMLMDFIEGDDLKTTIFRHQDGMDDKQVLEILRTVLGGIQFAHNLGIIHCDIKPGNIMLNENGKALLADFGISRMADAATATMVGAGTPAYMAPEVIKGLDPVPQSDIYSLGIVLFEMLTGGERPFTGELATSTGSTGEKVRWEQINMSPPSPRKFNPKVSKEMEAVVFRCLEKDPRKRYQNSLDLLNALEEALGGGKVEEEEVTIIGQIEDPVPVQPVEEGPIVGKEPKPIPAPSKIKKNQTGWLIGMGVVIVGLIGMMIVNSTNGGQRVMAFPTEKPLPTSTAIPTKTPNPTNTPVPKNTVNQKSTVVPTNTATPTAFSEVIGKIAFSSNRDGDFEIFIMDSDGSNTFQLTQNEVDDSSPNWSPDGSKIVFQTNRDGNWEIYIMDIDGSNATRLTNNSASDVAPSWSPDGNNITFQSGRDGNDSEIFLMDVTGSNIIQLTSNGMSDYRPTFSPNGSQIIYYSDISRVGYDIYTINLDGSSLTKYFGSPVNDRNPSWSSVVDKIVFEIEHVYYGNREIYVIDSDGNNLTQLTDHSSIDWDPDWSKDGNEIVFISDRDGNQEIYKMNSDGSNLVRLTNNVFNEKEPAWQP